MSSLTRRLRRFYDGLTDREQLLLKIAGGVLTVLALVLVTLLFNQSLQSTRNNIDDYETALDELAKAAPNLQGGQKNDDTSHLEKKLSPEAIEDNNVAMRSFAEQHGNAVGVSIATFDIQKRGLGDDSDDESGSGLQKVQLNVDINEVAFSKLMKYLERIELAEEPVFIERIRLTRRSRQNGTVQAELRFTTIKKEQG